MTLKPIWTFCLAVAALVAAGSATPAFAQYKAGHGINVTVYESPT